MSIQLVNKFLLHLLHLSTLLIFSFFPNHSHPIHVLSYTYITTNQLSFSSFSTRQFTRTRLPDLLYYRVPTGTADPGLKRIKPWGTALKGTSLLPHIPESGRIRPPAYCFSVRVPGPKLNCVAPCAPGSLDLQLSGGSGTAPSDVSGDGALQDGRALPCSRHREVNLRQTRSRQYWVVGVAFRWIR